MNLRSLIIIIFVFSVFSSVAQDSKISYGITGGFNYNSNGEYVTTGSTVELTEQFKSSKKTGYHAGIFMQFRANSMYVRPEIVYVKTKSSYESNDFTQTNINIPIVIGFDIVKPVSIFVGPSFQYILENELENIDINNVDIEKDLSVGFQVGVALEFFDFIRASIRYEKGVSENILTIKDNSDNIIGELDTKQEQISLTISLRM